MSLQYHADLTIIIQTTTRYFIDSSDLKLQLLQDATCHFSFLTLYLLWAGLIRSEGHSVKVGVSLNNTLDSL